MEGLLAWLVIGWQIHVGRRRKGAEAIYPIRDRLWEPEVCLGLWIKGEIFCCSTGLNRLLELIEMHRSPSFSIQFTTVLYLPHPYQFRPGAHPLPITSFPIHASRPATLISTAMTPAFVPGTAVSARSFSGRNLTCTTSTTTPASVTMSANPISRRQALSAAAAVFAGVSLAPLVSEAKSGDSPTISIFGIGGQSSPFTAGVQQGGKVQYRSFNDDEITIYKRIINDSKDRLEGAYDSIKAKSWEDIRSRIRLEASDLRKAQLTVNSNISDKKLQAAAAKAYQLFKEDLERLDQACVQKNQDKAYKSYNSSLKSLTAWQLAAGF